MSFLAHNDPFTILVSLEKEACTAYYYYVGIFIYLYLLLFIVCIIYVEKGGICKL